MADPLHSLKCTSSTALTVALSEHSYRSCAATQSRFCHWRLKGGGGFTPGPCLPFSSGDSPFSVHSSVFVSVSALRSLPCASHWAFPSDKILPLDCECGTDCSGPVRQSLIARILSSSDMALGPCSDCEKHFRNLDRDAKLGAKAIEPAKGERPQTQTPKPCKPRQHGITECC